MPKTEEECLDALREAAERLDESPTRKQYDELGLTPAAGTIMRHLGGWNKAKRQAGLGTFKQGEDGGTEIRPKPDDVDLPDEAEWKELTGQQRWYYKNREDRIERKDRRRREFRRWLFELKRDELSCVRCNKKRPPALDFNHPDKKELGIAEMIAYGYAKESIEEEIADCVVLCANCHRVEHYDPPAPSDRTDSV